MALSETVAVNRAERTLITPEGVDLRLKIADAGQRASAFLLDLAIIVGVLIGMTILALVGAGIFAAAEPGNSGANGRMPLGAELALVIWMLGAFVLRNLYFVAFELSPRAATPGKRAMGIRVASRDGGRLRAEAVFARNATRELEVFIPLSLLGMRATAGGVDSWMFLLAAAWCSVFVFFPLFNRDRLRAGDLIGGTWVVRVPKQILVRDRRGLTAFRTRKPR